MPATLQLPDEVFALAEATARDRHIPLVDFVSQSVKTLAWRDPLDIDTQCAKLAQLKDGWLDGEGTAYDADQLNTLAARFNRSLSPDLPLPRIYPMPDGRVQAEWMLGRWDTSIEVELPSLRAVYSTLNLDTHQDDEAELELSQDADWKGLNEKLLALRGGRKG